MIWAAAVQSRWFDEEMVDDVTKPRSCCWSGAEVGVGEKRTDERAAI